MLLLTRHYFLFLRLCCPLQVKLAELQDLVMRLVAERNDWYSRYAGAVAGAGTANPDLLPVGQDSSLQELQAYSQSEPDAASGAGTNKSITPFHPFSLKSSCAAAHVDNANHISRFPVYPFSPQVMIRL